MAAVQGMAGRLSCRPPLIADTQYNKEKQISADAAGNRQPWKRPPLPERPHPWTTRAHHGTAEGVRANPARAATFPPGKEENGTHTLRPAPLPSGAPGSAAPAQPPGLAAGATPKQPAAHGAASWDRSPRRPEHAGVRRSTGRPTTAGRPRPIACTRRVRLRPHTSHQPGRETSSCGPRGVPAARPPRRGSRAPSLAQAQAQRHGLALEQGQDLWISLFRTHMRPPGPRAGHVVTAPDGHGGTASLDRPPPAALPAARGPGREPTPSPRRSPCHAPPRRPKARCRAPPASGGSPVGRGGGFVAAPSAGPRSARSRSRWQTPFPRRAS